MPSSLSDIPINYLRDLCTRVTPGPWAKRESWHGDAWDVKAPGKTFPVCSSINADTTDLEFIIAARMYLPVLLEEIERLRGEGEG